MELQLIQQKIFEVRGYKIMLDFDLAELYGVETKVLNQAVKRNADRFPEDFMFKLSRAEWTNLRSQIVTSSWGGIRYQPFAFTEHGVTMLSSVLRSERAVQVNIAIVRAFVALRSLALSSAGLADYVHLLEEKYDKQFADVYEALNFLADAKKNERDWADRERIGFVKEEEPAYA